MPKTMCPGGDANRSSGINVTWTPSAQRLDISGWFDSFVGIEGGSMSLREFFDELGITEKDCVLAWNPPKRRGKSPQSREAMKISAAAGVAVAVLATKTGGW